MLNTFFKTGLLAILLLGANSNVVKAQSCCKKPSDMQALALRTDFKKAHESPLPLSYTPEAGKMIEVATKSGVAGHAFFIPSPVPSTKILLVFHEYWGLNDYIKREAEQWQKELGNVDVYAIDLYDGKVADNPDSAGKYMGSLNPKRGNEIIEGVLAKIGTGKQIGTLGWCMGGTWSFNGTILCGKQAAGCVMYYGFPEKQAKVFKDLKTDVLYIRGSKDKFISANDVDQFKKSVVHVGRKIDYVAYNADHAFANPSNPHYDKANAAKAHEKALAFLKKSLAI